MSISGGKSGLPPSGDVKNVTSNVLPEAPVDETTFRDKHHNQRKSKFTIFKSVKTLQNHWFVFTFCAFLPYKVGPPVSSVVMSYLQVRSLLQQSSEMNTIDLFAEQVGKDEVTIDVRIWFSDFRIFDINDKELTKEEFAENGKRGWNQLYETGIKTKNNKTTKL